VPSGNQQHEWDENDDLVALYLYRTSQNHALPRLPKAAEIAKVLGMSGGSLIRRRGNFAHLDGQGGLAHAAKQSIRIYERHKGTPDSELYSMALRVLEDKRK
jgi:hypothetical protein